MSLSTNHDLFEHPLMKRYGSNEMLVNFSDNKRYKLWRTLWYHLAYAQHQVGLYNPITGESVISKDQLDEIKKALVSDIDYEAVAEEEKKKRHDVMAHLYVWGNQCCPSAKGVLHLGATSCDITDNTDCILLRDGYDILIPKLVTLIRDMSRLMMKWKDVPCLGYTHFQSAQLITVGKRTAQWCQDLIECIHEWTRARNGIKFRGLKGTTGTQASFMSLFQGDAHKVKELERLFCQLSEFTDYYPITGQTTPRSSDILVIQPLVLFSSVAYKIASDIRLLSHTKEIEEPFEESQIGSSAMAYKRNPMRCERICALARHVITLHANVLHTNANQWLERSLDDSANRRITLSEVFLTTDAVLSLLLNVISGMAVRQGMIKANIDRELPFLATESILMAFVSSGGDRQVGHELIRKHSMETIQESLHQGKPNDLIMRLSSEPGFAAILDKIEELMNPKLFTGRASDQVSEFFEAIVVPTLESFQHIPNQHVQLNL